MNGEPVQETSLSIQIVLDSYVPLLDQDFPKSALILMVRGPVIKVLSSSGILPSRGKSDALKFSSFPIATRVGKAAKTGLLKIGNAIRGLERWLKGTRIWCRSSDVTSRSLAKIAVMK